MADHEDTDTLDLADQEDAQEEQDADAEMSDADDEELQDASENQRLYAGKYKSAEELERAYNEIQKFVGSRKELESKAQMYDRLVRQQARSTGQQTVAMPRMQDFVQSDGSIDVAGYDAQMAQWHVHQTNRQADTSVRRAQEAADVDRIERDFPYLKDNELAARTVMSLYRSGEADTIYEAAIMHDTDRRSIISGASKKSAESATRELSKKVRGTTESPGGRVGSMSGEMSPEKFDKLSQSEKQAYIKRQFSNGSWKIGSR